MSKPLKQKMNFSTEDGTFSVLAEDSSRIFIWYETAQQGAWLVRRDALFLRDIIDEWEKAETE